MTVITTFPEHVATEYYDSNWYRGISPRGVGITGRFLSPRSQEFKVGSGQINLRLTYVTKYSNADVDEGKVPEGEKAYVNLMDSESEELFNSLLKQPLLDCFNTPKMDRLCGAVYLDWEDQLISLLANRSLLGPANAVREVEKLIAENLSYRAYLDSSTVVPQIIAGGIDPIFTKNGTKIGAVINHIVDEAVGKNLKALNAELALTHQIQIVLLKLSFINTSFIEADPKPDDNGLDSEIPTDEEDGDPRDTERTLLLHDPLLNFLSLHRMPARISVKDYLEDSENYIIIEGNSGGAYVDVVAIIGSDGQILRVKAHSPKTVTVNDLSILPK